MSAATPAMPTETILQFPAERQDLRWRGFLGAERIERHTPTASSGRSTAGHVESKVA